MSYYIFHIDSEIGIEANTDENAQEKLEKTIKDIQDNPPNEQTLNDGKEVVKQSIGENAQVSDLLQAENN